MGPLVLSFSVETVICFSFLSLSFPAFDTQNSKLGKRNNQKISFEITNESLNFSLKLKNAVVIVKCQFFVQCGNILTHPGLFMEEFEKKSFEMH